jgi:hypothetical protein
MEQFVGLDVSQAMTHVCIIGSDGKTVWQGSGRSLCLLCSALYWRSLPLPPRCDDVRAASSKCPSRFRDRPLFPAIGWR